MQPGVEERSDDTPGSSRGWRIPLRNQNQQRMSRPLAPGWRVADGLWRAKRLIDSQPGGLPDGSQGLRSAAPTPLVCGGHRALTPQGSQN